MGVRDLGSRAVPATIAEKLGHLSRGHAPAIPVIRREIPYWSERGWSHNNSTYTGNYQTPFAAFHGYIETGPLGGIRCYLHAPSREIRRHSHWICFQSRGNDWYKVHMSRRPKDVSSAIITIERLIQEAYT